MRRGRLRGETRRLGTGELEAGDSRKVFDVFQITVTSRNAYIAYDKDDADNIPASS